MKRPAVFFDRDNTLIVSDGYLGDPDRVVLVDGAAEAVARVSAMGYAAVVFSNQSGVARGMFGEDAVYAVNQRLDELLHEDNPAATIDRHEFCPYHPEAPVQRYRRDSDLRKPRAGMIHQAARTLDLDLTRSWVIGDAPRDIDAGVAAGLRTVLLKIAGLPPSVALSERLTNEPDFVASSLEEAVAFISRSREEVAAPAAHAEEEAAGVDGERAFGIVDSPPTPESEAAAAAVVEHMEASGEPGRAGPTGFEKGEPPADREPETATAVAEFQPEAEQHEEPAAPYVPAAYAAQAATAERPLRVDPADGYTIAEPIKSAMTWGERMRLARAQGTLPVRVNLPLKRQPEVAPPPPEPAVPPEPEVADVPAVLPVAEPLPPAEEAAAVVESPAAPTEPVAAWAEPVVATAEPAVAVAEPAATEESRSEASVSEPQMTGVEPRESPAIEPVPVEPEAPLASVAEAPQPEPAPPLGVGRPRNRRGSDDFSGRDVGRLEDLAAQILQELRRARESEGGDFSVSKLFAGVTQVLVLFAMVPTYLYWENSVLATQILMVALVMQTFTISLLIMGRQK